MDTTPDNERRFGDLGKAFHNAQNIAEFLNIWLSNELLVGKEAKIFNQYYRSYLNAFSPRIQEFYASQIKESENAVIQNPGAKVLEVGCGLGTESLWLALKGGDVTAIDIRHDRVTTAKERQSVVELEIGHPIKCEFRNGSFLEMDNHVSFDIIWMEQAFHHLEPRIDVIRKAADLLNPGGYLVISEANALNPVLQLELLLRRGWPRIEMQKSLDGSQHPYGVERITTARLLSQAFKKVGICQLSVRHFRMFPNKPVFESLAIIERTLTSNALAPLLTHFNYVGQKAA